MILKTIPVGDMRANCYILAKAPSAEAIIIDPGADYPKIESALNKDNLKPQVIINTHGHIDHIGANHKFGVPVWIHQLDADLLTSPVKNGSLIFLQSAYKSPPASRLLEDGEEITVADITLKVIHTPGHTPGGICLKVDNILFTGDTLFAGSVGRTDLPDGSQRKLINSIKGKLLMFDDSTVIYPGHGPSSTIGNEKRTNPFL
jgi:glyoxylase-like metal-dependent hydrolase (beta-lactamase superfamily II)